MHALVLLFCCVFFFECQRPDSLVSRALEFTSICSRTEQNCLEVECAQTQLGGGRGGGGVAAGAK